MARKNKTPSNNFCITCGRATNDKKLAIDSWTNQFFVCDNYQKIWCGKCMGQETKKGPAKTFKL